MFSRAALQWRFRILAAHALCGLIVSIGGMSAWALPDSEDDPSQSKDLNSLSLEELGKVKVTTVSKDPQEIQKTPAAVYVISREEIERSGATSLPEALRLAPGVEVARIDAAHWSVAVRGFAGQFSKSLLVLIDGRSVYTPLFSGVYWDAQNVMLEDVDRIEVIRGPGGTIWGANAVNGVINIITRPARETVGTLADFGGGNVDQGVSSVRYGQTNGSLSYRFYAKGGIRGPELHSDGDNFDHWRMGQVGFRSDWTRGANDTFTLQGDSYLGESGERLSLAIYNPLSEADVQDKSPFSGGNLLTRWQHRIGEGSDIQLQAYFDRTNRGSIELGETRNTFDVDYMQRARPGYGQELAWGAGARVSPSHILQTSQSVLILPNKETDSIYSGFLQYEIPLLRNSLSFTLGSKFEHTNFSGYDYQPSARLMWSPTVHQSAWLSVARAVRTPSRVDQDVQFNILIQAQPAPPIFFQIEGNPKLRPEKLLAYEAGYRAQVSEHLYVDFAAFFNIYDDLQGYGPLSIVAGTNPPPVDYFIVLPYANVIEGRSVGAEVSPVWDVAHGWQLRGAYSLLHLDLKDRPGFTDVGNLLSTYLGSSPTHVANVQSILNLPGHVEFNQTFRYSSQLTEYGVHPNGTVDVRVARRVGEGFSLAAVGQNLLRPSHPEFGGDPGPLVGIKRSAYLSITWTR